MCSFYHVELDPASLVGTSLYVPFLWQRVYVVTLTCRPGFCRKSSLTSSLTGLLTRHMHARSTVASVYGVCCLSFRLIQPAFLIFGSFSRLQNSMLSFTLIL